MSRPGRKASPNINTPTNASVTGVISAQRFSVELSDIPVFSLGPSVNDYANTLLESISSICSGSPPGIPPPDHIPAHHQDTVSPVNNDLASVRITYDDQIQADSRTDDMKNPSTSNISKRVTLLFLNMF